MSWDTQTKLNVDSALVENLDYRPPEFPSDMSDSLILHIGT